MGGEESKPEPPKEPEKTVKEMTKEAKKTLDGMIREFRRETFRLEMDAKKMKKDLEKQVKKGEPKSMQRMTAQNYLKKQQMIERYKGLEAKIEGVKISLANVTTSQSLVETMQKMGQIMNKTSSGVNINNIQQTITQFNMAYEKQEIMGEMVGDAMDMDGEEVDDTDADALIDDITGGGKGGKQQIQEQQQDDFSDQLAGLKM